jgi:hypothetical protein
MAASVLEKNIDTTENVAHEDKLDDIMRCILSAIESL